MILRLFTILLAGWLVAACTPDEVGYGPKHQRPVSAKVRTKMQDLNMALDAPILVRIFKEESQLEVWKQTRRGRYALLETYDICKWSGKLGPKIKEGDRQAPEGFYTINPYQMNPNSSYHLSFNMGFPNAYDRAFGRTGSNLMVHGACSSRGCYAMTDEQIQDIYAMARDAFRGGQRAFEVHAFPFKMTPENMARHRSDPNYEFWAMLKTGYDHFEVTKLPPKVDVCDKRYVFNAQAEIAGASFSAARKCPAFSVPAQIASAVSAKEKKDNELIEQVVASLERKKQREEDAKKRQEMIAKLLGGGKTDEASGADTAVATAGGQPAAGEVPAEAIAIASGHPLPRPAPHRALALQPEKSSETGSFFSSLFGGEKKTADAPAPLETASSEATATPKEVQPAAAAPATREVRAATPPAGVPVPATKAVAIGASEAGAPPAGDKARSGSLLTRIFGSDK